MASLPPKKGPHRMSHVGNPATEEAERLEFEANVDVAADRVFEALERARSKMTPEEKERAVRHSEAILNSATDGVTPRRKRA